MNKLFGTKIIISESTYYSARNSIITRELDLVTAKGTSVPIRIYELIAVEDDISSIQRDKINLFEEGVKIYREKRWDEAKEYFLDPQSILLMSRNDS